MSLNNLNPCCCCSFQSGTRVIGAVQIIQGLCGIALWIFALYLLQSEYQRYGRGIEMIELIVLGIALFWNIFIISLGALILVGANERNARKCRIWFYTMVIKAGFLILAALLIVPFGTTEPVVYITVGLVIADIYMLCVVHSYIKEIESSPMLLIKPKDAEE